MNLINIKNLIIINLILISKISSVISIDNYVGQKYENYFLYSKAAYNYYNNKFSQSEDDLKILLSHDKNIPIYIYSLYIKLFFSLEKFDQIITLEPKIKNVFDDDIEIQMLIAQSYINKNQEDKADKLFEKLSKKYSDNEIIAYYTAVSFIKNRSYQQSLAYLDKCLENMSFKSKHFLFYFLKSKIFLQEGLNEKALDAIKKSLDLFPEFDKGWLLKALLEEQQGRVEDAIKGYKKFLDLVGRDLAVEKQLINLLFATSRYSEAAQLLKRVEVDSPEYFFDLALTEFRSGKSLEALKSINKSLKKDCEFKKAKILKIEILYSLNKKEEAVNFIKKWLITSKEDSLILNILLLLKKNMIENNTLMNILEEYSKKRPTKIVLATLADLYLEESLYNKFLACSEKLIKLVNNGELKSKILFQIGYVYFVRGFDDKVEKVLIEAMKFKPTHSSVYNLLAYFYAKKDKKLNIALKLARKAIKDVDEDCSNYYYYYDTYGYILYKLGKIKEALEFFRKAQIDAKNSGVIDDPEIISHIKMAEDVLSRK